MQVVKSEYIVVGGGIAGLVSAITLAKKGLVVLLTKANEYSSNSYKAQGGIAAALGTDDSPKLHFLDTVKTGLSLCNKDSVDFLVNGGSEAISFLQQLGVNFDRNPDNTYALGREGAHTVSRILHAKGDATGAAIVSSLFKNVLANPNITVRENTVALDLIQDKDVCYGVRCVSISYLASKGVVLATGGCGQVYKHTTNDLVSTGDGFAIALRAGVKLVDMEFVQFHPTALAIDRNPMFLISEAVRGEGASLISSNGERFMRKYHSLEDLAPRDVVSRAIYNEMCSGHKIYLDATLLGRRFQKRFPGIHGQCLKYGIDPGKDLIPVTPAAHFIMGGIKTDLSGQTSLSRLFACGEVACSGVHGANRLASNSLLEGVVFALNMANKLSSLEDQVCNTNGIELTKLSSSCPQYLISEIKEIMWNYVGIIRTSEGLHNGLRKLKALTSQIPKGCIEILNMHATAQVITLSALKRTESRGGHYREDFPCMLEEWENTHILI